MSADNGIYILKTPVDGTTYEYRVKHAQAIDNIYYYFPDGNPDSVAGIFGRCQVFNDVGEARRHAHEIVEEMKKDDFFVLEYGVSEIELHNPFSYYVEEATKKTGEIVTKKCDDGCEEFVGVRMRDGTVKKDQKARCFRCEKEIEAAVTGNDDNDTWEMPQGVAFTGGGSYGSTVYDAGVDGVFVELVVCDECLKKHKTLLRERKDTRQKFGWGQSKVEWEERGD